MNKSWMLAACLGIAVVAPRVRAQPASTQVGEQQAPRTVTLAFENTPILDVLGEISQQGKVNIVIGGDVKGDLGKVFLTSATPEVAIERVCLASGLQWRKLDETTYFVGRVLPVELLPPTQVPAPVTPQKSQSFRLIHLQNVPPRLMAWWLDPQHQARPEILGAEVKADTRQDEGGFDLPAGVDRIIAAEPQSSLLIYGTAEGIARLQEIVTLLDQPLRQVEVEAQFFDLSDEAEKQLGLDFGASAPGNDGQNQIAIAQGNFRPKLQVLSAARQASLVSESRLTMLNNFPGKVSALFPSIQLKRPNADDQTGDWCLTSSILIYTNLSLTMKPTINNDDTITLILKPQLQQTPGLTRQAVQAVANLHDGDTLAIRLAPRNERHIVAFITPRIIREAETAAP